MSDLQKLIERLNDPEKYVDAVDEAVSVLTGVSLLVEKWCKEADPEGEVDNYDDEFRATTRTLLYCSNELASELRKSHD